MLRLSVNFGALTFLLEFLGITAYLFNNRTVRWEDSYDFCTTYAAAVWSMIIASILAILDSRSATAALSMLHHYESLLGVLLGGNIAAHFLIFVIIKPAFWHTLPSRTLPYFAFQKCRSFEKSNLIFDHVNMILRLLLCNGLFLICWARRMLLLLVLNLLWI